MMTMELISLVSLLIHSVVLVKSSDPNSILYPGQVNLGLLAPFREGLIGNLSVEMIRSAMACVWAIEKVNSRKEAGELNIGVYLYDTCGKQDVAQRQVFHLMEHLGHVHFHGCPDDRGTPIAGVITLEKSEIWETPAKMLEAFKVPLIATDDSNRPLPSVLTTGPSYDLLIRSLMSFCEEIKWNNMAFNTIDSSSQDIGKLLKEEATKKLIDVHEISTEEISSFVLENNSIQVLLILGNNVSAAIAIAENLQRVILPIVIITTKIINEQTMINLSKSLTKEIIVMSSEELIVSEFENFWKEKLNEGISSEHPLISELAASRGNYSFEEESLLSSDISDVVKAIWTYSECLKSIQKKFCNQGNDCVPLIKRALTANVLDELSVANFTINNVFNERNVTVIFDGRSKKMATGRFVFHLLSTQSNKQIGYYDEGTEGLHLLASDTFLSSNKIKTSKKPRSSSLLSPPNIYGSVSDGTSSSRQNGTTVAINSNQNGKRSFYTSLGNSGLGAWVSRPWCLAVIVLCTLGILSTIYMISFLLMKSCEGALKKRNLPLMFLTLFSILIVFSSAVLFIFRPSVLICGIRRVCHNMSISLISGCLLLQGMHLRSQELLGLGGRVSRLNQFITFGFIIGVQAAMEVQQWAFKEPTIRFIKDVPLCTRSTFNFVTSQIYLCYIIVMGVIVAFTSRNIPYNLREGQCLWFTTLTLLVVFVTKTVLYCVLEMTDANVITLSIGLIIVSYVVLGGMYIPYLYEVHRQGGMPHKPLSYAESMSTVFTMFKQDAESVSGESTISRGRKEAKTLDRSDGMVEMTHNPLYDDFRSVYT